MKTCTNCGALLKDDAMFCTQCGAAAQAAAPAPEQQYSNEGWDQAYNGNQQYQQYQQPVPPVMPYDHTSEYDPEDISNNKVYCMLGYLSGFVGIIIALLASGADRSPYINFHIRQAIKFSVINSLTNIVMVALCFTFVIPIAGAIWKVVLLVLKIIAFVQVCMGKAKEPPIIRAFPFLK